MVSLGKFSANAFISALSVVFFVAIFLLFLPTIVKGLPIAFIIFTAWMFISLILGVLDSQNLPNQVNYQFPVAVQQFIVWCLFIAALYVGLWIGKDEWVYKRFEVIVILTGLFWAVLILLPGTAFNTRSLTDLLALIFSVSTAIFVSKRKSIYLLSSFLIFFAILVTSSRMALIACLAAFSIIQISDFKFLNLLSWRKLVPFLIIGSILIGFIFIYPPIFERFSPIFRSIRSLVVQNIVLDEGNLASVTQGRSTVWPALFNKALEKPLLGHGVGIASAYSFYYSNHPNFTHPHNEYLRIFFDTGLLGLSLFLNGFLSIGSTLIRYVRKGKTRIDQKALLGLGALGVALSLFLTSNSGFYSFFMAPLGFILGLAIANTSDDDFYSAHNSFR